MIALELIEKTREYLDYLERHILNVRKAWIDIKGKCGDMHFVYDDYTRNKIEDEVNNHDLSKLTEQEFVQYRKSFYPVDEEPKFDMSEAWEHHKAKNPHHFENWTAAANRNTEHWRIYCVHMLVDWLAMSYEFGDSPRTYYEDNLDD
jgi:hypothetical protein